MLRSKLPLFPIWDKLINPTVGVYEPLEGFPVIENWDDHSPYSTCVYIYIYIYIERERESEMERETLDPGTSGLSYIHQKIELDLTNGHLSVRSRSSY